MGCILYLKCAVCGNCEYFLTSTMNQAKFGDTRQTGRVKPQNFFYINRRMVVSSLETGIWLSGVQTISHVLNLNFEGKSHMWASHAKAIFPQVRSHVQSILDEAREEVRRHFIEENGYAYHRSTEIEIGVSYDGTWSKRGFTANYGLGFQVSADTGKVLDYEFLSKVCPECNNNRNADEEWKTRHKIVCKKKSCCIQ